MSSEMYSLDPLMTFLCAPPNPGREKEATTSHMYTVLVLSFSLSLNFLNERFLFFITCALLGLFLLFLFSTESVLLKLSHNGQIYSLVLVLGLPSSGLLEAFDMGPLSPLASMTLFSPTALFLFLFCCLVWFGLVHFWCFCHGFFVFVFLILPLLSYL